MHHAVDIIFKSDKQTELCDVFNSTGDFRANRIGSGKAVPRIVHALFQAKRNTTLCAVDFENHDLDFL